MGVGRGLWGCECLSLWALMPLALNRHPEDVRPISSKILGEKGDIKPNEKALEFTASRS